VSDARASTVVVCPACGKKNRVPATAMGTLRCGTCQAWLPLIVAAHDDSFRQVVLHSQLPVLVDLWAPWCGPCRAVSPALERLAREFAGRVKLVKVNVDESPLTAQRFDVQSIPTLVVLDHGNTVALGAGAASEATLRTWLEKALTDLGR
jgi:thioredoxin 2